MAAPALAVPVVVNGSFEAPGTTGNTIPGWSIVPTWFGVVDSNSFPASDGAKSVWMGGTDTGGTDILSQTILGFTANSVYKLTFDMVPETCDLCGRPGAYMHMGLTGADIAAADFEAHTSVNSFFNSGWQAMSLTFTATGGAVTIAMHGDVSQHPSWEFGLDNFRISEIGTVPEPGSLALMGLGLAGLGFLRRKASAL